VASPEELVEENRALRAELERLRTAPDHVDPMLRAVFDHAPAFLNVISPQGRFLATGRTSEAFGSVIGRTVFEFTPADQHETLRAAFARVVEAKTPTTYESIGYGENGEPNHVYFVRAVPVVRDDVVEAIVLVPTDITERVRLERSLAASQQQLRAAVDATRMGLWRWDVDKNEITWDQRLREIFGVDETPAGFEPYVALIHPEDRAQVPTVIERALMTGVYTPFEHRLASPRDDERWLLCTGTVLMGPDGKPAMLMGGALDITEQKRAATQRQRAQRVEILGQLTAGLAHNFNNLLGVIIPNLEHVLAEAKGEPATVLGAALQASTQARDLIKRLMAMSTRSPGTASDAREVVERVVAIGRATFPREIDIGVAIASGVGHVAMDATDLEQIVLNLLLNARDALERAPRRARVIRVEVERKAAVGGEQVVVSVRDNGVGMSAAVQERVFEPFFTTKPAHRGTGLGLADALLRVRDAGGKLECESALGEGTTFVLRLPAAAPPAPRPASPTAPRGSRGETILIVDDEPGVSAAVGRLLRQQGYVVLTADGAAEARATLAAKGAEVRLVLLDQSMPGESGPEALPSLRALTDAPVLMFTGGTGDLPAGATGILQKPVQADELLTAVHEAIARRS
jgi:PAS domain S-box-containing protein